MNSMTLAFSFFLVVLFAFFQCQAQLQRPGVTPTPEETELCKAEEDTASNKTLVETQKNSTTACKVTCKYSNNETKTINSPNDQSCSIMTTLNLRKCKDGECKMDILG